MKIDEHLRGKFAIPHRAYGDFRLSAQGHEEVGMTMLADIAEISPIDGELAIRRSTIKAPAPLKAI